MTQVWPVNNSPVAEEKTKDFEDVEVGEQEQHQPTSSKNFITDIDFDFLKTIFTLKKVLFPFTLRKCIHWIIYFIVFLFIFEFGSMILSSIGFADFDSAYKYSERVWLSSYDIIYVMALLIDPFYVMLSVIFGISTEKDLGKYPIHPTESNENEFVDEFVDIALVISCHNSSDLIEETLKSALVHFKPANIYISDNGNSELPGDNTRDIVFDLNPMVHYRWVKKGNKNFSQFLAVRELMKRDDIKYVMVIDDDVKIPENLTSSIDKFDDITKGVMYGIKGVDEQGKQESIFTRWQDLEYKVGDFIKKFQTRSTVLFPHGAVSLWEKNVFYKLLGEMDTIFFAEDVKMGLHLQRNGYRLHYNQDCIFETVTPSSILGESPNFYAQRVRSWDFGEHMMFTRHLGHFLFGYVKGSIFKTLLMRTSQVYVLMTIFNDWFRIPIIVTYLTYRPYFFMTTLALNVVINMASILIYNYWSCRNRSDIRTDFVTIVTSPIYKFMTVIIRLLALFYCLFIYWPNYKPSPVKYPGLMSDEDLDEVDYYNSQAKIV